MIKRIFNYIIISLFVLIILPLKVSAINPSYEELINKYKSLKTEEQLSLLIDDCYHEKLYYSKLDDVEKQIYKLLYDSSKESFNIKCSVTGASSTNMKDKIDRAACAFKRDYPEVFWLKGGFSAKSSSYNGKTTYNVIVTNTASYSLPKGGNMVDTNEVNRYKIESDLPKVLAKREVVTRDLKNKSDYEKIKGVHDWLCKNNDYFRNSDLSHRGVSALRVVRDNPVCEGYAEAFMILLNYLNVPVTFASGDAQAPGTNSRREAHAWNFVKLNGFWYSMDVTWDDPTGYTSKDNVSYEYFLFVENTTTHPKRVIYAKASSGKTPMDCPIPSPLASTKYNPNTAVKVDSKAIILNLAPGEKVEGIPESYKGKTAPIKLTDAPTRQGYKFIGWYDETGKQIKEINPTKETKNFILTPKYEIVKGSTNLPKEPTQINPTNPTNDPNNATQIIPNTNQTQKSDALAIVPIIGFIIIAVVIVGMLKLLFGKKKDKEEKQK